jgi:hypothetical protein
MIAFDIWRFLLCRDQINLIKTLKSSRKLELDPVVDQSTDRKRISRTGVDIFKIVERLYFVGNEYSPFSVRFRPRDLEDMGRNFDSDDISFEF